MQKKPRVVLDTNLIVSGLISPTGTPSHLLDMWTQGGLILLTSTEFLSEVEQVLHRDHIKQRYHLAEQRIHEFLTDLRQATEPVIPLPDLPLHSRDPKDDKLLALALGGSADYLITGDDDLLVLDGDPALANLRIITATAFLQK
jgi:putative PIN family toxin of toxin-antitoxin system